jgi:cation:H+ antiporter
LPDSILFWTAVTLLMTTVLLMGLIRREKRGIAMIGFESFVNLLLYGSALVLLIFF